MELSVSELLKFPFLNRPRVIQQKIVTGGRHPLLKNLPMKKQMGASHEGHFRNPILFEKVQWLVRCDKRRKFFCWTCLLFNPGSTMLKARVNSDLPAVLESTGKHEIAAEHIEATLKLQIFMMENFQSPPQALDKTQHNVVVRRNREIVKRLIDAVCCAVVQKHSHGDGNYTFNLLRAEDCDKFFEFLRAYDRVNVDVVDAAAQALKRYPRIVNNLVDAITRVVKTAIKNETQQSTYVSVILSEHGAPQSSKSQISTVLRYVKRGKLCERFIGFTNVHGCNSLQDISKLVLDTIEQYGVSERFLALSLDGKVLPKQSLIGLILSIRIHYQYSYFVPWHSHGFGSTLLQTLSVYEDCGLFLKKLNAMENFFQNSSYRESFSVKLTTMFPQLQKDRWYETVPFIIFVAKFRIYFIEFFEGIIKTCRYRESDDVTKAIAFRAFLQDLHSVFLLRLFNKVFSDVFDESFNFVFDSRKEMFVFSNPRISAFKKHVGSFEFQDLWVDIVKEMDKEGQNSKLTDQLKDNSFKEFHALSQKILRHLYQELDIRCNYFNKLKFCDLLNCNSKGQYALNPQLLLLLMAEHGPFFNDRDLASEVDALNSNSIFQKKSVHELLDYFADLNLRNVFPQLYKLAEFILTLPFLPVSQGKESSKLKDINNCSYIPENSGIPSGEVSFLCVETEMLRDMKNSALFYEDVIARFYEVNQSFLLVQV